MIGTIAVVVDSAAYLPQEVAERYGLITVPLTVVLDGEHFREFVDLDAPEFYEQLAAGAVVSTSQPPPAAFADAYARAAAGGAEQIVSIHISAGLSGTLQSAHIAAADSPVPVRLIDTGQASFIEGLCVWELCEALADGASVDEAESLALRAAQTAGNVFVVRGLDLLKQGGRFRAGTVPNGGVPVLALRDGAVQVIGEAKLLEDAMDAIIGHITDAMERNPGKRFRIGISNGAADKLAGMLEARVRLLPAAAEVMQYIVGPVVGAHTGPGCTGAVFLPRPVLSE